MAQRTHGVSGDFDLAMDELRVVARYVVRHAESVLPVFEQAVSDDPRPHAAIDATWVFINGAARTNLQRVASLNAHRAARSARSEVARLAARSAGDAASVSAIEVVLPDLDDEHADRGLVLTNLCALLHQRFDITTASDDLHAAVRRRLRRGCGSGHRPPGRRGCPAQLETALAARHRTTGQVDDLRAALEAWESATALTRRRSTSGSPQH